MIAVERPASVGDVLDAVKALAPAIAARSPEIEAARRLPTDLLDDLKATGVFRVMLPESHGGYGADALSAFEVFATLAAADGSTGWISLIGACAWLDLAGLPRATFDAIYNGSDVITAGAFRPDGAIETVDDGYRVSGRWAFVSGCEHADVVFGNCLAGVVDGVPRLRIAVFRPEQLAIEDTWHVNGLRGTGSHHVRVDDIVVPADRTHDPLAEQPCIDQVVVHIPAPPLLSCAVATIALGIARGALADIVQLAEHKMPMLDAAALATNPAFQITLATADAELRAAESLVRESTSTLWSRAAAGSKPALAERARVRAASVWATGRAAAIVDAAYRAAGSSSLYLDSPLQRRLRDVHAVTQHFLVRPDTMLTAGAILAGNDVDVMVF
jgi:alkylation response protein AidB-like acyl-CoA dehydrogenase